MTVKLNPAPELLTFKMFPKVDQSPEPPYDARTEHGIGYTVLQYPRKGSRVGISLIVTVSFVAERSWVVRAKQHDSDLLHHERLHLMIAACGGYKVSTEAQAGTYADERDAESELKRLHARTLLEVDELNGRYDADTNKTGIRASSAHQKLWKARIEGWYRKKTLGHP